jgi:DNA replication protein DnaC
MEDTRNVFQRLLDHFEKCGTCPICGGPLYHPSVEMAGRVVPGACPACGYKEPTGVEDRRNPKQWQQDAAKKAANNYLVGNSLTPNGKAFGNTFETYVAETPQEQKALEFAHAKVETLIDQPPAHVYFAGPAGTGKTHLATAILLEYIAQRNYKAKALYVDWQKYADMVSNRYDAQIDVKQYLTRLTAAIQECDLLLLDDFGAEVFDGKASKGSVDLANTVFSGRVDKNIIVTTNLSGEMVKDVYGQRIVSRLRAHMVGNALLFANMKDHRALA